MKVFRSIAMAVAGTVLFGACGLEFNDPTPATIPTPSFTGSKSAPDLWIPVVPTGRWRTPGDLCRIITPAIVAIVLDYPGAFRAYPGASGMQILKLIDACSYASGPEPRVRVIVTVREDADDSVWNGFLEQTSTEYPDKRREIISYTLKGPRGEETRGVWHAMSTPNRQGLVWTADSRLGVVQYDSRGEIVSSDQLVILAKMALDATKTK